MNHDILVKFVVRRAFRHGSVLRSDILKVSEVSTATATRVMTTALNLHAQVLQRDGYLISPKPLAQCPGFAAEADFLETLDRGLNEPLHTGLFEDELPVTYVSWCNSMPPNPGTFQTIVRAIQEERALKIVYIGLRYGEEPRARQVLPISLERMNDQWRVIAQDLEDPECIIKPFVLPRILSAEISPARRRGISRSHADHKVTIPVELNHRFSEIQKKVLANEFMICDRKVSIASRSMHEFERRFTGKSTADNVVWPPLIISQ